MITWALFTVILSNSTMLPPTSQVFRTGSLKGCKDLKMVIEKEYKGFIAINECIQVAQ